MQLVSYLVSYLVSQLVSQSVSQSVSKSAANQIEVVSFASRPLHIRRQRPFWTTEQEAPWAPERAGRILRREKFLALARNRTTVPRSSTPLFTHYTGCQGFCLYRLLLNIGSIKKPYSSSFTTRTAEAPTHFSPHITTRQFRVRLQVLYKLLSLDQPFS